ncbi:MAG: Hsp70 family protein [Myxococcota bacterium]
MVCLPVQSGAYGFDLGTTNSAAAVFDGERSEAVRNDQGSPLTPSVVRIDAKGRVTVGQRAKRQLGRAPDEVRGEFKRLMGTGDTLRFAASEETKTPEELAGLVLRSLRRDVADQTGVDPECAVVSVPALFELPQSAATSRAAELAGLSRVELIAEPIASAIASGWSAEDPSGAWLVYDLGGGTFDVSLLETRDGLLRVVGHDGDNFLGGRDFDWALVDVVLQRLAKENNGKAPRRGEPRHESAVAQLKLAVEDLKIQLSRRREADLVLDEPLVVDGSELEVAMQVSRSVLEEQAAPIVERTVEVCRRLLADRGVVAGDLARIVFVGGPTQAGYVRDRVLSALGAPAAEGHDPMTLVARGAAIYAASAGLDARPTAGPLARREGRKVWLQFPALSSDLTPHVVGRVLAEGGGSPVATVSIARTDGGWRSPEAKVGDDGGFILTTELVPRRRNIFTLHATTTDGAPVQLDPPDLAIMQGLSVTDPPLSRSVGVALADDTVQVYFERGVPLPARRTFTHRTVESVARGSDGSVLKIPIVQGEMELAHLCRHVGTLEIAGDAVTDSLPAGAAVEVTLQLDRGGQLSAQALVPSLSQSFDGVAQLMIPDTDPDALSESLATVVQRIKAIRSAAIRDGSTAALQGFKGIDVLLAEIERDIAACRGGDTDAGQRARRNFLDAEATIHDVELSRSWPELSRRATETLASAHQWVTEHGTEIEHKLLEQASLAATSALDARDAAELQRQLRVVRRLRNAAYFRHPEAWAWQFEAAASEAHAATDLSRANTLVADGRRALERGDNGAIKTATEALWRLLPPDAKARRQSFDSGVR